MAEYIKTYSGKHFFPTEPNMESFCIEDVAHALSYICRGNGHVKSFFSVGQHCIMCAHEAAARGYSRRLQLACLLHDASEAYMSDVPRPFKHHLKDYNEMEEKLLSLIYMKYLGTDLTVEETALIKEIDNDLLAYDLCYLLGEGDERQLPEVNIRPVYDVLPFLEVEKQYLEIFFSLQDER